jgi:hypothetical protein
MDYILSFCYTNVVLGRQMYSTCLVTCNTPQEYTLFENYQTNLLCLCMSVRDRKMYNSVHT